MYNSCKYKKKHILLYMYLYMHIYICVCVCMCFIYIDICAISYVLFVSLGYIWENIFYNVYMFIVIYFSFCLNYVQLEQKF